MTKSTSNRNNSRVITFLNVGLICTVLGLGFKTLNPELETSSSMSAFGGINLAQGETQQRTTLQFTSQSLIQQSIVEPVKSVSPITSNVDNTPVAGALDPAVLSKGLEGFNGTAAIFGPSGEIIAQSYPSNADGSKPAVMPVTKPASTLKIISAMYFLKKFKPTEKLSAFGGKTALQAVNDILLVSDNKGAENLAIDVGIDSIQSQMRLLTGNQSLTIGNGSGCPRKTFGFDTHDCSGENLTGRTNTMTAIDVGKAVIEFQKTMQSYGLGLKDVMTTSYADEFAPGMPAGAAVWKTGTLNDIKAEAGQIYKIENGKVVTYTFVFINEGPDHGYAKNWHAALKALIYTGRLRPLS